MTTDPFTEAERITIPRPHVPHGPKGITPEQADADYLREAAWKLEEHYKPFGSNLRATIVKLVRDAADAVEAPRTHLAAQEPDEAEVEAAAQELWKHRALGTVHPNYPWDGLAPELRQSLRELARAALSAARAVRNRGQA